MKKVIKLTFILWSKWLLGIMALLVWIGLVIIIVRSFSTFLEQAPYCMISTILIFGILTVAYKGLDYWGE